MVAISFQAISVGTEGSIRGLVRFLLNQRRMLVEYVLVARDSDTPHLERTA